LSITASHALVDDAFCFQICNAYQPPPKRANGLLSPISLHFLLFLTCSQYHALYLLCCLQLNLPSVVARSLIYVQKKHHRAQGRLHHAMRSRLLLSALLFCSSSLAKKQSAFKRGLVYISSNSPSDISLFTGSGTDLSWYYNYDIYPESDTSLSFVPMLFGLPDASTNFLGTISSLLQSSDPPRYVLSFNEPDMPNSYGGSDISPHDAAVSYLENIAPLRNSTYNHIKVSLPSTSGSNGGIDWLTSFNASCYSLNPGHGCPSDFISTHWYGDFTGLASWLGQIHEIFPSLPIWVTEFADPTVSLDQTQAFFNESTSYLDRLDYVDRYAWFGMFRAENANPNIGPNISFLDDAGELTDLGSWYLGGNATGNLPSAGTASTPYLHTSMMWLALGILFLISHG